MCCLWLVQNFAQDQLRATVCLPILLPVSILVVFTVVPRNSALPLIGSKFRPKISWELLWTRVDKTRYAWPFSSQKSGTRCRSGEKEGPCLACDLYVSLVCYCFRARSGQVNLILAKTLFLCSWCIRSIYSSSLFTFYLSSYYGGPSLIGPNVVSTNK